MSAADIAKKYKISKQRVYQILDKHIDPVKKDLTINE
jgi:Mor family transcriptional regulator